MGYGACGMGTWMRMGMEPSEACIKKQQRRQPQGVGGWQTAEREDGEDWEAGRSTHAST